MVERFRLEMKEVDPELMQHFNKIQLNLVDFSYRWMYLLLREMPLYYIARILDVYFTNDERMLVHDDPNCQRGSPFWCSFHLFFCCSLLRSLRKHLLGRSFEENMKVLQNINKMKWSNKRVIALLRDAQTLVNYQHNMRVKWKSKTVLLSILSYFQISSTPLHFLEN